MGNQTVVSEFFLVGFSDIPQWNMLLVLAFTFSYIWTLSGNTFILSLIIFDSGLHTPMYFFLSNLCVLDICCISVTAPQFLYMFYHLHYSVSFSNCITQVYFYLAFTNVQFFLLPVMAYDRYRAICNPLRYHVFMSKRACVSLAVGTWAFGFINTLSYRISHLIYCISPVINHFFCDLTAVMKLSCSDTSTIEHFTFIEGVLCGFLPLSLQCILKIHSSDGRQKAFSTCASHLTVVILFYGTVLVMHMRPSSHYLLAQDKPLSVLYTAIIPILNPLIYSLRNKNVKKALGEIPRFYLHK
uniref:G-protein coupled receptors family 1 profile domain-containing protein n=1 Tax=Xenopus tropicalis TaxID=8364 RepID=A0A803K899_XENTR